MKKLVSILLTLSLLIVPLSLTGCNYADAKEDSVYTNSDVVKEVAYAYYYQGKQLNYNQTLSRRNVNVSPEDATSQHLIYLDCSSYVNAVYNEAFGVNIIPDEAVDGVKLTSSSPQTGRFKTYVESNPNNEDVIGIWYAKDYSGASEKQACLNEIKSMLEPGDVINYRRSSNTGHAIMYLGNNEIIHSIGDDFSEVKENSDPWNVYDGKDKGEANGTVQLATVADFFDDSSSSRYLMANVIESIMIIRPLARNLTPTEETKNRMLIKGLELEKTSNKGVNTGVYANEEITYTVTITNNRDKGYKNLVISDVLDSNLSFVSATNKISANGQTVSGKVTVKAGETVSVSWTCKVKSSATAGTVITSNQTTVGGVKLASIQNSVSKFSGEQLNLVALKAKEYAESLKKFNNPIDFVETLYREALSVELFDYDTVYNALGDVIDTENKTLKTEQNIAKMVAPNLYGGYKISSAYTKNNDLVRLITTSNLSIGDVIIAEKDNLTNSDMMQAVYVYVGGNELVAVDTNATSLYKNRAVLLTMSESRMESSNLLVTIYAFNRYAVLRPGSIQ